MRSVLQQPVFMEIPCLHRRLPERRRPEKGSSLSLIPDTAVITRERWKALHRRKKWPWWPRWPCTRNWQNTIMWMSIWLIRMMWPCLWQTGHNLLQTGMRISCSVFITTLPWIMICSDPKSGSLPYSLTTLTVISSAGNRCSRCRTWDCFYEESRRNLKITVMTITEL